MEIVRNAVTAGSDEASVLVAFFCLYLEILVGQGKKQGPGSAPRTLPATLLVTIGGFITNAAYCLFQNAKNKSFKDYADGKLWARNILFCALAGLLWYSQFFGLSLGKGFLGGSAVLLTFSWCILMSLDIVFSNVWGIILKEWKGLSFKTIAVLLAGLAILVFSTFLPQLLEH